MKESKPHNYNPIGGWRCHQQAKFKDKTKIDCECEVCGQEFEVRKSTNHIEEIGHIFTGNISSVDEAQGFWATLLLVDGYYWETTGYDEVTIHISVCPNCDHEEEMFCENIKQVQKVERHRHYSYM
jgi:hypothetical protein